MSVDCVFFSNPPLVVTTGSGVVTDEELLACWQEEYADARIPWEAPGFLDLRAVERFEVTSAGLRKLVALDAKYTEQHGLLMRSAIVAPSDLAFGMSRMYQILSDGDLHSVGVFRSLSDAEEWLGVRLRAT
jgi:hypothetical protein